MTSKALMGIQSPFDTFEKRMSREAVMMDNPTMQDVLRQFYPSYLDIYTPNVRQAKAVHHIHKKDISVCPCCVDTLSYEV